MFYDLSRQCPANHYPYIVQPGDTLYNIASRLEVSVSRILAANPWINPNNLGIGQTLCIPACPPNYAAYIIQSGDTLYKISQLYNVSISAILTANPSVDPSYLRVGQRICIPQTCPSNYREIISAMQSDINMLKAESNAQRIEESNYGNSTKRTRVLNVTVSQIQFDAAPAVFSGDYSGHYTTGHSYPYYAEAASGGQRGITVKDNFGVWHIFGYHVPLPQ
jgi:LysM repeat protein